MLHISLTPEVLTHLWGMPITNTLLTSWIIVIGISIVTYVVYRTRLSKESALYVPGRIQNMIETIIEALSGLMESLAGDSKLAAKYFPFVATIFIYVLVSNWIGMLPGIGSIGFIEHGAEGSHVVPFFRSVYTDLNMTIALSLLTVITSHIIGIRAIGAKRHAGKYFTLRHPLATYTGILELIGELSKIISLSFRLFGNVFAGEVLLIVITFLVPYVAPSLVMVMEFFVGLIQAVIFAALAMLSFSTAVHAEDHN